MIAFNCVESWTFTDSEMIERGPDSEYVTYSKSDTLSIISESVKVQDSIQLNAIIMTVIILVAAGILASIFVSRRKAQRLN